MSEWNFNRKKRGLFKLLKGGFITREEYFKRHDELKQKFQKTRGGQA